MNTIAASNHLVEVPFLAQDVAPRLVQAMQADDLPRARGIVGRLSREQLEDLGMFLARAVRFSHHADEAVRDSVNADMRVSLIARFVADSTGVTVALIYGKSTKRQVADARAVVEAVAYRTGLSTVAIAKTLGRNHSGVSHSNSKVWQDPTLTRIAEETLLRLAGVGALT